MFKFGTIGAFKQVRNNPRCKAVIELKNGMVVFPDDSTGNAPTAATAVIAKTDDVYVVWNIIDKPEIRVKSDFVIEIGEFVRTFKLADLIDLPVELSYDIVKDTYSGIAIGDLLVPCDDTTDATAKGKWKIDASTASAYKINLKVLEKTTYGDKGLYCKVIVN